MWPSPTQQKYGHLHLSGMLLGMDLRTCTKKCMCLETIERRAQNMLTILNSIVNVTGGDLYDTQ